MYKKRKERIRSSSCGKSEYSQEIPQLRTAFLHTDKDFLIFYHGIENRILPMLSYLGCHVRAVHWLYWNPCTLSSSDVLVMLKWRHHNMSHLSVFKNFWEPF